jgi:hypothetical protein
VSIWWFEKDVMTACKRLAGRSASDRRQWLREHLAVSLDWSNMDRIDIISLKPGDEAPAVKGSGGRQSVWQNIWELSDGTTTSRDYWKNYGKCFPGGARQTVFSFIPLETGTDLNRFLRRPWGARRPEQLMCLGRTDINLPPCDLSIEDL